jgi:hypothetical protein
LTEPATASLAKLPARTREHLDAIMRTPFDSRAMELMQMPLLASDIVVATFPKSGTTWMQQICHGLRAYGDMDFTEISEVVPWIEQGHKFGIDAAKAQAFEPRVFKTHLEYTHVNKGARYIHVVRDPKDVLVSYYRFMSQVLVDPQAISIDSFADICLFSDQLAERTDPGAPFGPHLYNYWRHLIDWWRAREVAPVLTLAYEQMQRNLPLHVTRVAEFMNIESYARRVDRATLQATFEFMSAHRDRFSDRIPGTEVRLAKVVDGKVGSHSTRIDAALASRIDAAWQHYITPELGFDSYEALMESLALEWC